MTRDRQKQRRVRRDEPASFWAYLTTPGREGDLLDELGPSLAPVRMADGIVMARGRARAPDGTWIFPAFARRAMVTTGVRCSTQPETLAEALAVGIRKLKRGTWTLKVLSPPSRQRTDPRKKRAEVVDRDITEPLEARLPTALSNSFVEDEGADWLAEAWLLDTEHALVGWTRQEDSMLLPLPEGELPKSSKARQLALGFALAGIRPGKGERCTVLAERPREWSAAVEAAGARVSPVGADASGPQPRGGSEGPLAFRHAPQETLDWVLIDLNRPPAEVVKLIAKWGRRVWAHQFLANLRLPGRERAEFLAEARQILEEAGWRGIKARQIVDGDSALVHGWLDPRIAVKGWQPPFELRSRAGKLPSRGPRGPRTGKRRQGRGRR